MSDDDEPRWVMGPISKPVPQCIQSFRQKQMRLDELTQPGWGDAANYFRETDMKYGTAELRVPAVVMTQIDTTAATTPPKSFGEHMHTVDIVRVQWQILAVTSRPGSSRIRLGSEKPQLPKFLLVHLPDPVPHLALIHDAMPVEPVSLHPCIRHRW